MDKLSKDGKPVTIQSDRGNAILISEKDWSAIQETLYLLSIPGMRESIKEGLYTSIEECDIKNNC
ncbi:MAG: type II toxin-antitoxin system Phd/YefM family antitoxin [Cyanobacteria bacterium J06643_5]